VLVVRQQHHPICHTSHLEAQFIPATLLPLRPWARMNLIYCSAMVLKQAVHSMWHTSHTH